MRSLRAEWTHSDRIDTCTASYGHGGVWNYCVHLDEILTTAAAQLGGERLNGTLVNGDGKHDPS